MKPFLTKQLQLYGEATTVASSLATSTDEAERAKAQKRFWELYWGELGLVENREVEGAMKIFGDALRAGAPTASLQPLSLDLAHAIRRSLDKSWGVNAWTRRD